MVRFVDDIFGIPLVEGEDSFSKNEWNQFKNDTADFGIIRWEINEPSSSIDFLNFPDLTIEIENGSIITETHQKAINLYQHFTPNSAHPP